MNVKHEAVIVQRLGDARGPGHVAAALADGAVAFVPDVHAVAAASLGGIAGGVRRLDDGGQVARVAVDLHEADAGADAEAPAVVLEAEGVHALVDLLRHAQRLAAGALLQDHPELVAAHAGQGVARAHQVREHLRQLLEQLVAHRVTGRR